MHMFICIKHDFLMPWKKKLRLLRMRRILNIDNQAFENFLEEISLPEVIVKYYLLKLYTKLIICYLILDIHAR